MQARKVMHQALMQPPREPQLLPQSTWDKDTLLTFSMTLAFAFYCQHKIWQKPMASWARQNSAFNLQLTAAGELSWVKTLHRQRAFPLSHVLPHGHAEVHRLPVFSASGSFALLADQSKWSNKTFTFWQGRQRRNIYQVAGPRLPFPTQSTE